ncbi:MAG TPA: hypothetical protein VL181_10060, partial [Holophagaceae bacterium]|nr:hypothetical protein [Holophagaceae bacterium]
LWASYLMGHARVDGGWSALPAHWGEQLNAKDMFELFDRGEVHGLLGTSASTALFAGLFLILWASWKHQAEAAGLRHRLGAWIGGLMDALIAGIPLVVLYLVVYVFLAYIGDSGVPPLGWIAFYGRPLLALATLAALMTQWWLLRLNRLERKGQNWFQHLWLGFQRLWQHPVQWTGLALGGALFRLALHAAVIDLAWRMGGATVGRVWIFVLLEALAALIGAWVLGWMLRAAAMFWRHDQAVRRTVAELEAAATATAGESFDA